MFTAFVNSWAVFFCRSSLIFTVRHNLRIAIHDITIHLKKNKSMKATLNKKLHERALAIIEMIEEAERRIEQQERNKFEVGPIFFDIATHCDKRIATHRAAIERLEKSYIETVNRINKAI